MFFRSRDKLVNLDNVARGELVVTRNGTRSVTLFDNLGHELVSLHEDAFDQLNAETLIAGPVAAAIIAPDGVVEWRAIVAWRIGPRGAEPVFHGARPAGVLFLSFTGGELLGMGRRFPNIDAAVEAVRAPVNDPQEAM